MHSAIALLSDPRAAPGAQPAGRPRHRRATAAIAERYKAGEAIGELARDDGAEADEIEEAIRSKLELHAA